MDATLGRFPILLVAIIFSSSLSLAVCPGSRHQTTLAGYALSPDATRIAAVADDGSLFWWDVASGTRTQLAECVKPEAFHPIVFSPDSARLAVVVDSAVEILNVSSGSLVARLTSSKLNQIYNLVFSGDGRRLAASYEAGVVVWDIVSRAEIASFSANPFREALAIDGNGTLVALGCWDGLKLWSVAGAGAARSLVAGSHIESVLFMHRDQWIVALSAAELPLEPKQHIQKYRREIAVWDSASGKKLKTLQAGADLDELQFGLISGGADLVLGMDFTNHLRAWDLESGELKATWETSSGHPSTDGKLLLREGGAPGRLALWEIGSADKDARTFEYKSPLCASSLADDKGNVRFDSVFIGDGFSEEGQPLGSYSTHGYVAGLHPCDDRSFQLQDGKASPGGTGTRSR